MASAIEAAADALIEEIRWQLETWNHRPPPTDETTLSFPRVGGLPQVQHNEQPLTGKHIAIGTLGRRADCQPDTAAAWWTEENRKRFAYCCQERVAPLTEALLTAARTAGGSAVLIEPLSELKRSHDAFLRAVIAESSSGILRSEAVRAAWFAIYPAADRVAELVDELAREPDLSPVQDAIYRVLTTEYQSAVDIAIAAGCDQDNCRRELANLKLRMGLVDHKPRIGYRRANARADRPHT